MAHPDVNSASSMFPILNLNPKTEKNSETAGVWSYTESTLSQWVGVDQNQEGQHERSKASDAGRHMKEVKGMYDGYLSSFGGL